MAWQWRTAGLSYAVSATTQALRAMTGTSAAASAASTPPHISR